MTTSGESEDSPARLRMEGISKSFGGVAALRDVDFELKAGQVHGLVGENGAGKSTLMKIIAGVHTDYQGRMFVDGRQVHFHSARDALDAGIGMVHQELSVVPDLTVAENVYLGTQPTRGGFVDWKAMAEGARAQLLNLGIDVDPKATMGSLPIGLQQLIELARVLFSGAGIIILDEPTSALSPPEVRRLFGVLEGIRASGRSIIFISHFLDDVLSVSDMVTVFRNGRRVVTERVAEVDKSWVIERMIGRGHEDIEDSYTGAIALESKADANPVLTVRDLSYGRAFSQISLQARAGEVLGIYGFMGCGQIELSRALFGKIMPDQRDALDRRQGPAPQAHRRGAPRRHSLRAGKPARDALLSGARLQEHLDQHPRPDRTPVAQAADREGDGAGTGAGAEHPPARRDEPACQPFGRQPAESGARQVAHLPPARARYSASRPAAWTSAPRTTSSRSCVRCATRGSRSSSYRPSRKPCCRSPTASW